MSDSFMHSLYIGEISNQLWLKYADPGSTVLMCLRSFLHRKFREEATW